MIRGTKLEVAAPATFQSTEAGGLGAQKQPWLPSKFKTTLGCLVPYTNAFGQTRLKNKGRKTPVRRWVGMAGQTGGVRTQLPIVALN